MTYSTKENESIPINTLAVNPTKDDPAPKPFDFPEYLHRSRFIYWLYGITDSLAASFMVPKLIFEALYSNSTLSFVKEYHHFLSSPEGLIVMVILTPIFLLFSAFGTYFDDTDPSAFNRWLSQALSYERDMIKALKWAYKGFRNLILDIMHFIGSDLRYLILPIGIILVVISILNRFWYRAMKEERKLMQAHNQAIRNDVMRAGAHLHVESFLPACHIVWLTYEPTQNEINFLPFPGNTALIRVTSPNNQPEKIFYVDRRAHTCIDVTPSKQESIDEFDRAVENTWIGCYLSMQPIDEARKSKNLPCYVWNAARKTLSYINFHGKVKSVTLTDPASFENHIATAENHSWLNPDNIETYITNNGGHKPQRFASLIDPTYSKVFDILPYSATYSADESARHSSYQRSYVFIPPVKGPHSGLFYYDESGHTHRVEVQDPSLFHSRILHIEEKNAFDVLQKCYQKPLESSSENQAKNIPTSISAEIIVDSTCPPKTADEEREDILEDVNISYPNDLLYPLCFESPLTDPNKPCYVYLSNANKNSARKIIFYNPENAQLTAEQINAALIDRNKLESTLRGIKKNKNLTRLTENQLDNLLRITLENSYHKLTTSLTLDNWEVYASSIRNSILQQQGLLPNKCLFSALWIGLFDQGLYFYLGIMLLTSVSPSMLIALLTFSVVLTIVSVSTRIYEEYSYQRKLRATKAEVNLALSIKKLNLIIHALSDLDLYDNMSPVRFRSKSPTELGFSTGSNSSVEEQIDDLLKKLNKQLEDYTLTQQALYKEVVLSYGFVILEGLANGLAMHGVLSGFMVAFLGIATLISMSVPPALIISCTIIGIACLFMCATHALIAHHTHITTTQKTMGSEQINPELSEFITQLNLRFKKSESLSKEEIKTMRLVGRSLSYKPLFKASNPTFISMLECLRLGFSGGKNGPKILDESLNGSASYHSSIMFAGIALCFITTGVVSFLKGLAKEIGASRKTKAPPISENEAIITTTNDDIFNSSTQDEPLKDLFQHDKINNKLYSSTLFSVRGSAIMFPSDNNGGKEALGDTSAPKCPTPPPSDYITAGSIADRYTF